MGTPRVSSQRPRPGVISQRAAPAPTYARRMAVLGTKIHVPVPRRDVVPRTQLTERLDIAENARLVLVSAPPGFGKTTLLSQWVTERSKAGETRVAWLSLDAGD